MQRFETLIQRKNGDECDSGDICEKGGNWTTEHDRKTNKLAINLNVYISSQHKF